MTQQFKFKVRAMIAFWVFFAFFQEQSIALQEGTPEFEEVSQVFLDRALNQGIVHRDNPAQMKAIKFIIPLLIKREVPGLGPDILMATMTLQESPNPVTPQRIMATAEILGNQTFSTPMRARILEAVLGNYINPEDEKQMKIVETLAGFVAIGHVSAINPGTLAITEALVQAELEKAPPVTALRINQTLSLLSKFPTLPEQRALLEAIRYNIINIENRPQVESAISQLKAGNSIPMFLSEDANKFFPENKTPSYGEGSIVDLWRTPDGVGNFSNTDALKEAIKKNPSQEASLRKEAQEKALSAANSLSLSALQIVEPSGLNHAQLKNILTRQTHILNLEEFLRKLAEDEEHVNGGDKQNSTPAARNLRAAAVHLKTLVTYAKAHASSVPS